MKPLDRWLQQWRGRVASRQIVSGSRVADVGCGEGEFLSSLGDRIVMGVGVDPCLKAPLRSGMVELHPGNFPHQALSKSTFDFVVLLAVLEHFEESSLPGVVEAIGEILVPGGKVVLTVPSPKVDVVLKVLVALRLADGMSLDQHHGFEVEKTIPLFEQRGFKLERHQSFQLGFNHLFVFRKGAAP